MSMKLIFEPKKTTLHTIKETSAIKIIFEEMSITVHTTTTDSDRRGTYSITSFDRNRSDLEKFKILLTKINCNTFHDIWRLARLYDIGISFGCYSNDKNKKELQF